MTIMTEEEIEVINNYLLDRGNGSRIDYARAIEAAVIERIKSRGAVAAVVREDGGESVVFAAAIYKYKMFGDDDVICHLYLIED